MRARRQQAGLGLRTFAGLIDERASTVSAIESEARPPWRSAEKLARVAEVLGAPLAVAMWQSEPHTNGHAAEPAPDSEARQLLWWWTSDEAPALERETAAELAAFLGAETANAEDELAAWPSLTELAIEWRVRQLLGRRGVQLTVAPVDVEAALEGGAGVRLEIVPGLVPRFSVQACAVREPGRLALYVDRIVADSRPLASYRDLVATCFAPAVLSGPAPDCAGWFLALRSNGHWPQALRDCQRFALAMLLPAGPVLNAAESAYQELVAQQGWVDVDTAARTVRNRLAEQFAVPPTLVHRRLVGWPCHVYGRIAQALAAEETTLPPCDWWQHEREQVVQRELFAKR